MSRDDDYAMESFAADEGPVQDPYEPLPEADKEVIGRNLRLNETRARKVYLNIEAGNSGRVSAQLAGISMDSMKDYMEKAKKGIEPYATFAANVEIARARHEQKLVDAVRTEALGKGQKVTEIVGPDGETTVKVEKGLGSWKAAQYLLERSDPSHWGTGRGGGVNVTVNVQPGEVKAMTNAKLVELAQQLGWTPEQLRELMDEPTDVASRALPPPGDD